MSNNEPPADAKDSDVEITQKFTQSDQNDCNTLDLATFDKIPRHLTDLLNEVCKCKNYTNFDLLNAIVVYSAFENSLYGEWLDIDLSNYTLSWSSVFNMRIMKTCSIPQNRLCTSPLQLTFKFTLESTRKIVLNSLESGGFTILTLYEKNDLDEKHCQQTVSLALPTSRYVPFKKLCDNVPNTFRHLKELSTKLKERLFIPILNRMYENYALQSTPWLNGLPDIVLVKIFKYLRRRDLENLKCTCRKQNDVYKAFVSNKKRKFE